MNPLDNMYEFCTICIFCLFSICYLVNNVFIALYVLTSSYTEPRTLGIIDPNYVIPN